MRSTRVLCCVLLFCLSACGGPERPLDIGMKEIGTDVLIGPNAGSQSPSPAPASSRSIAFPSFVEPPLPTFTEPSPQPTIVACPTTGPITTITHELTSTATKPPAASSYTFHNSGSFSLGAKTYPYPSESDRIITNIRPSTTSDDYQFDVAIAQPDGSTTTTTYHVYPSQPAPTDTAPGMYIEQVVTKQSDGTTQNFAPTPALEVIPFPASTGSTWSVRSIDPLTQVVMQYDATISTERDLDVCGKRLVAWEVDISNGSIRSPSSAIFFTASVDIGTQYGGLSLADSLSMSGTDNGTQINVNSKASITKEPITS
ncbi:MAG: hypothetical protein ACYDCC_14255 [Actinomycetota bacterium]